MFDLDDKTGSTRSQKSGPWDRLETGQPGMTKRHDLDSDDNEELHRRLLGYYQQELDRQSDNRIQQAVDEDFYDSIQWSEEDAFELRQRGQAPVVYNVIAQSVNWIIGTEKRGRTDFRILPREKDDAQAAERKTQLLKYLADVNRTTFHRSRAFEDAVKVGIGWLEDGVQDDDDGEPIYSRYESWRNVLWDSASTEMDLDDCRYIIRTKWVDIDVAKAVFPERKGLIEASSVAVESGGYDLSHGDEVMDQAEMEREMGSTERAITNDHRSRVRLIEVWFRKPENVERIVSGQFRGEMLDAGHPGHTAELEQAQYAGQQITASRLVMRMYCAIMTTEGLLYLGASPYRHNRFPFTPIWGYRRGRDGMPYGIIRGLRDIQESVNKRASKALYILSTNKVMYEENSIEDVDEWRKEAARPDAMLPYKGQKPDIDVDRSLADSHLNMMMRDITMIQQVGGVTDEQMGRTTNATSGRAIEARQEQGSMTTAKLFDNLRLAFQVQGEKQLSLEEQYYTEEKRFRITNDRGTPEYIAVNDGLPENDITRTKADFVISEGDWRASIRQAAAEQLLEMITRMPPEVAMVMLDLVVESMDLPNREEMVRRIRSINGQRDPEAEEPTQEEMAQMQAQAAQQQLMQAMQEAELRKKMADAGKSEAEAQRIMAQAQEIATKIAGQNISTQDKALEAAVKALLAPQAVPVADGMLHEAGYQSRTEQEQEAQRQARQQADEQRIMQEEQAMAEEQQAMMDQQQADAPDGTAPHHPQQ